MRKHGILAPRQAAKVLRLLASAIRFAHGFKGNSPSGVPIVHLDIKPRNILGWLPNSDSPNAPNLLGVRTLKIGDFGLARVAAEGNFQDAIGGTPGYAAPEMLEPHPTIDVTADLFALGMTLLFMLTGKSAYPGAEALFGKEWTDSSIWHGNVDRYRVWAGNVRDEVRDGTGEYETIPQVLRAILGKCLEPDPTDRYQTADQLACDLDDWLNDYPTQQCGYQYSLKELDLLFTNRCCNPAAQFDDDRARLIGPPMLVLGAIVPALGIISMTLTMCFGVSHETASLSTSSLAIVSLVLMLGYLIYRTLKGVRLFFKSDPLPRCYPCYLVVTIVMISILRSHPAVSTSALMTLSALWTLMLGACNHNYRSAAIFGTILLLAALPVSWLWRADPKSMQVYGPPLIGGICFFFQTLIGIQLYYRRPTHRPRR